MTSASQSSSRAGLPSTLNGGTVCAGWSVGNTAPSLRSVTTQAPSRSASLTRCCQACASREPRPNRISGRCAPLSSAAAASTASRAGRDGAGGVKRVMSGHSGSLSSRCFLQAGVEADIDRRGRRGAGQRYWRGTSIRPAPAAEARLVVPLDERADQAALIARGVDPVDPRAALLGVERAGGAEHDHRRAVAPGVVEAHHAVQQPDIAVQHAGHRLAGRLGVAVRDRHRMVLVQAEQDAGRGVAEMVDQAVVQPAIARPRIEADIGNAEPAQHLRRDVAAPGHLAVGLSLGSIELHVLPRNSIPIRRPDGVPCDCVNRAIRRPHLTAIPWPDLLLTSAPAEAKQAGEPGS